MPLPLKTPIKTKERREVIGPILHFRGVQGERWRVSALFVLNGAAEPPDMKADGVMLPIPPRHVATRWASGMSGAGNSPFPEERPIPASATASATETAGT